MLRILPVRLLFASAFTAYLGRISHPQLEPQLREQRSHVLGKLPRILGMATEKQIWVRMPIQLVRRIEAEAKAEDRTFSSMVRRFTEEALTLRAVRKGEGK